MNARKLLVSVSAACLLLALTGVTASAGEVTLGPSTPSVSFEQVSTTTLAVSLGTCTDTHGFGTGFCSLSGLAAFLATGATGSYVFKTPATTSGPLTVPYSATFSSTGVYPLVTATTGTSNTFSYSDNQGDTLGGSVNWVDVVDGTPNPLFDAVLTVTSVSGTPTFDASYKVGQTSDIDFTLHALSCTGIGKAPCNLESVFANSGATASATISSGEVPPVPEPASMALLATALFGAYGLLRRRIRPS